MASLAVIPSEASFRTWITRVAINEVLQQYRQRGAIAQSATALYDFVSQQESALDTLVRREARDTVRTDFARLPEKYRLVLIVRDLDEMTTKEAARRLWAGTALVKTRLFRARQMLATAIISTPPMKAA